MFKKARSEVLNSANNHNYNNNPGSFFLYNIFALRYTFFKK